MKEFIAKEDDETSELSCAICLRLLVDALEIVECGHLFCSECISLPSVKKCPMCRCTNMKTKKPNRTILRLLEMAQGYCGNCGWVGTNEQYQTSHSKVNCAANPSAVAISSGDLKANVLKPSMSTGFGDVPPVPLSEGAPSCGATAAARSRANSSGTTLVYGAAPSNIYGQPSVVFGDATPNAGTANANGMPISTTAAFPTISTPTNGPSAAVNVTPFGANPNPNPALSVPYPYPPQGNGYPNQPQQQQQGGGAYGVPSGYRPQQQPSQGYPPQGYPQQQQQPPQGYPQQARPQPSAVYPAPSQGYYAPVMAQPQPTFGGIQPSGSGMFVDGRGRANTLPGANGATATGSSNSYINPFSGQAMHNPHPIGANPGY